jgi:hypothetical protein
MKWIKSLSGAIININHIKKIYIDQDYIRSCGDINISFCVTAYLQEPQYDEDDCHICRIKEFTKNDDAHKYLDELMEKLNGME